MLEEERRYQVDERFTLPDLAGCAPAGGRVVPRPPVTLRETYYDTPDRRLARAGVAVRYHRGEPSGTAWTVRIPSGSPGLRHEVCRPGTAGVVPSPLMALLSAYHRGVQLEPAAVLRTVRTCFEVRDAEDRPLLAVCDDAVEVLDGRRVSLAFREVETWRLGGRRGLLDRVEAVLRDAGARAHGFAARHARAMGAAAQAEPDVPPARLPRRPSAGDVAVAALRRDVARIIEFDPFVRLREPLPGGDTAVHQMRVGCRRLRSDLRTFRPLLKREWAESLRTEVGWLADALGAARDVEVLRTRLHRTASDDPLAPLDEAAVARLDADLAARHEEALVALDAALGSTRYLELLERLVAAVRQPQVGDAGEVPARWALPVLVARPWRRLAGGGADGLTEQAPDLAWHEVRLLGKRARYAAEAVAGVLGGPSRELAGALAAVQDLLGEHQDATVAAQTWLAIAASDPDDHALAVTAGRLYERERAAVRRCRSGFGAAWHAATRKRVTAWLR